MELRTGVAGTGVVATLGRQRRGHDGHVTCLGGGPRVGTTG
jgi:hypothetical protein